MSREDDVHNIDTQGQLAIGLSAFVGITGGPGVVTMILQYMGGGTCVMVGASAIGASLSPITYVGGSWISSGFLLTSGMPVVFGGPAAFYLGSAGATSIVQIMRSIDI